MTKALNIATMIAQSEALIAKLETARLVNTIASHNTVVIAAAGFALDFDFEDLGNGTRMASNPRMIALTSARQFTRKDARTLAATCTDGAGNPARAMFINDAVDMMQAQQRELIATLRSL